MIATVRGGGTGRLVISPLGPRFAPARVVLPVMVARQAMLRGLGQAAPAATFETSSGNIATPAVGEVWTISIASSPAYAGQPVTMFGAGGPSAGVRIETRWGNLDANGFWSLSGHFTPDQIGSWFEDWRVGGQSVGVWQFNVVPASTGPTQGPTAPASAPAPAAASAPPPVAAPASSALASVPGWAWLAIGAGGLYFLGGHRH